MKLSHDLEKQRAPERKPTFEEASARLERTGKSLDRAANRLQGDAALVSRASSVFLERLKLVGEDFAAKTKLLSSKPVLDLTGVRTKEELQSRETIVQQFI